MCAFSWPAHAIQCFLPTLPPCARTRRLEVQIGCVPYVLHLYVCTHGLHMHIKCVLHTLHPYVRTRDASTLLLDDTMPLCLVAVPLLVLICRCASPLTAAPSSPSSSKAATASALCRSPTTLLVRAGLLSLSWHRLGSFQGFGELGFRYRGLGALRMWCQKVWMGT